MLRVAKKITKHITNTESLQRIDKLERSLTELEKKIDRLLFDVDTLKNSRTIPVGQTEVITTLFTGQKMYVDTRDISVAPSVMVHGIWEPEITSIFRRYITPDSVVFDIGANFGYFGIVAGTEVSAGNGSVHFFEANPAFAPLILKSLAVNGLDRKSNIVIKAIGEVSGETIQLSVLDHFWGSSNIKKDDLSLSQPSRYSELSQKKVPAETVTIDDYCKQEQIASVNIIKIDIEGYEDTAYKGMKHTIKNSPDLILFLEFTATGYKDPKSFFNTILSDFTYTYVINSKDASLIRVKQFSHLGDAIKHDWVMLVASKRPLRK